MFILLHHNNQIQTKKLKLHQEWQESDRTPVVCKSEWNWKFASLMKQTKELHKNHREEENHFLKTCGLNAVVLRVLCWSQAI